MKELEEGWSEKTQRAERSFMCGVERNSMGKILRLRASYRRMTERTRRAILAAQDDENVEEPLGFQPSS